MPSQNARILTHLQAGHSLTPLGALEMFGCFRLAARVYDLRQAGHDIREDNVTFLGKTVGRYCLPRQPRQTVLPGCSADLP